MNKKKSIINILFYILIMVLIYILIINNGDVKFVINKTKSNSKKYITLNLKNAKETKFSLSENGKEKTIIYYLDDKNDIYLIELIPSTVLTDKVDLMIMEDIPETKELKIDLKKDNKFKKKIKEGYYTNYNLDKNINILKYKLYFAVFIVFICVLFIIVELIKNIKKI